MRIFRLFLSSFLTACFLLISLTAYAGSERTNVPIFIQPYQQPDNSRVSTTPTIVNQPQNSQMKRQSLQRAQSNNDGGFVFRTPTNPYAGTAYGRITTEIKYFDKQTQRYMNQYDYMAALNARGDSATLNQVRNYIQQNGVFDPRKYQAAMTGSGSAKQAGSSQNSTNASPNGTIINRNARTITRQQSSEDNTPQKLHRGYDDESQSGSRPIFLR
jgi:hypothetical protein